MQLFSSCCHLQAWFVHLYQWPPNASLWPDQVTAASLFQVTGAYHSARECWDNRNYSLCVSLWPTASRICCLSRLYTRHSGQAQLALGAVVAAVPTRPGAGCSGESLGAAAVSCLETADLYSKILNGLHINQYWKHSWLCSDMSALKATGPSFADCMDTYINQGY